jgi:pimeloyl-ACP methyl ester carboxylesterase
MRNSILFIALFLVHVGSAQSNKWTGLWAGTLSIEETRLAVAFKISVKHSGWYTMLYVPQQGAKNIVASATKIDKKSVRIEFDALDIQLDGRLADSNTIKTTFHQNGKSYPLELTRVWGDWPKAKPQTPKAPFAFVSENVKIPVAKGRVMVAATLSKPDSVGTFPVIILISGSGPQDRNGSIGEHQPFLLLTDAFTKMGFAVFRYDDRGAGETKGHPEVLKNSTTKDIADDISQFVDYLKSRSDIDTSGIGLLGHSEGGMVAPMVASKRQDIAFIISLAGPAAGGLEANIFQNANGLKKAGLNEKNVTAFLNIHRELVHIILQDSDTTKAHRQIDSAVKSWAKKAPRKARMVLYRDKKANIHNVYQVYDAFQIPWWHFFFEYLPAADIQKLRCPVLALNGEKDIQVPCDLNLTAFQNNISDSSLLTAKCIPGLNHLFQNCKTCTVGEYFQLDETMSEEVMSTMTQWLTEIKNKR